MLSETKVNGISEFEFYRVSGKTSCVKEIKESDVEKGWSQEGVVLLSNDRFANSVTEGWK